MATKKTKQDDAAQTILDEFLDGKLAATTENGKLKIENGVLISYDKPIAKRAIDPRYIKILSSVSVNQYQRAHLTRLQECEAAKTHRFVVYTSL